MRVAEQLLHGAKVGSVVEQMGRKRVPQHVGADLLRQRRRFHDPFENVPRPSRRERVAAGVNKQIAVVCRQRFRKLAPPAVDIPFERLTSRAPGAGRSAACFLCRE